MKRFVRTYKRFFELSFYVVVTTLFCVVAFQETQAASLDQATTTPFAAVSIGQFNADEQLQIENGSQTRHFVSAQLETEFSFNGIGARWNRVDAGEDLPLGDVTVTVVANTTMGEQRRVLAPIGDDTNGMVNDSLSVTKPTIINDATSFYIEIDLQRNGDTAPILEEIELLYFNTTAAPINQFGIAAVETRATSDERSPVVVTRKKWGADESLRKNKAGEAIWPIQHVDPEVFIIHHTAGTDGGTDPAATIRAIYFWHTTVLGWGDIGYNYLIGPDGTIYEGRFGGAGAVGAHTYNSATNTDYNTGSVGIALLGCFEETPGACINTHEVTPEMNTSLASLIGSLASDLHINPKSSTTFKGGNIKRIVGHRDLDATFCPGSTVHDELISVRAAAKKVYTEQERPTYSGVVTSTIVDERVIVDDEVFAGSADEEHAITLTVENTGSKSWVQGETILKVYNKSGRKPTGLRHDSWPSKTYGRIALNETIVAYGEYGTFTFLLDTARFNGPKNIITKVFNRKKKAKGSNGTLSLQLNRELEGKMEVAGMVPAILRGTTNELTVSITNTGSTAWTKQLAVEINDSVVAKPLEQNETLEPGESMEFIAEYTAPGAKALGERYLRFNLTLGGREVANTHSIGLVRID